jgi:hypothetical protein
MTLYGARGPARLRRRNPAGGWHELVVSTDGDDACFGRPLPDGIVVAEVAPCRGTSPACDARFANAPGTRTAVTRPHLIDTGAPGAPPEHRALRLSVGRGHRPGEYPDRRWLHTHTRRAPAPRCNGMGRQRLGRGSHAIGGRSVFRHRQPWRCDGAVAVFYRRLLLRGPGHLAATAHRRLGAEVFGAAHLWVGSDRPGHCGSSAEVAP